MNEKKLRVVVGLLMFHGFLALGFFIGFIAALPFKDRLLHVVSLGVFWYMWMPAVLLIVQNYYLLTRVFRYKEV